MEIPQITFLRFVAAMGVIVFHAGRGAPSVAWGEPLWAVGNTAVSFFFVLSGFILSYVYAQRGVRNIRDFYVARLARIVPLYWLALFIVAARAAKAHNLDILDFFLSFFLLQAFWPGRSQVLNTPGWSLSVELFFYVIFPFLLPEVQKIKKASVLVLGLFLVWALNVILHIVLLSNEASKERAFHEFVIYHPFTHVGTFITGVFGGQIFIRERERVTRHGMWLITGGLALFLIPVWLRAPFLRFHHNGLFAPCFLAFVLGLAALPEHPISKLFSLRPLVVLGEASYGVYILQIPIWLVYASWLQRTQPNLSPDLWFWLFTALVMTCSFAAYYFVEIPMRARVKNWAKAVFG